MVGLPDDYNHAAFVRRYERDSLTISNETHAVAAVYYISHWLGIPTDDAALHDSTWEAVYENGTSESEEDEAYQEVSDELKKQYLDRPSECLRMLGSIIGKRVVCKTGEGA